MFQLTEDTYEQILVSCCNSNSSLDLTQAAFIDPYGMVGLIEMGEFFKSKDVRKILSLPQSEDVLKYLERMDFFRFAGEYFELDRGLSPFTDEAERSRRMGTVPVVEKYRRSSHSDVLLEITPIEKSDDIHFIVGKVKERANAILTKHLHYDERAINGFIVALSEVCQNIIEHSENKGFAGIQKYHFNSINKNVVKIAVMDLGIGFRKSLSERFSIKDDFQAIEKALLHGASRYADEGRGHGLAAVKRFASQWNGKLSIRSGTAKLSIIPDWSWGKEKEINLARFPGSQIGIMLPEI